MVSFGIGKEWNSSYTTGADLQFDSDAGVILSLSVAIREDIELSIPVRLSEELSVSTFLVGSAIPALGSFLFERFILLPYQRITQEVESNEELDRLQHTQAKEEAEIAVEILKPLYYKRIKSLRPDDLLIEEATYTAKDNQILDVKIPLQMLVVDNVLKVEGGHSKSGLIGFYDVSLLQPKCLTIHYTFRGRGHRVRITDGEALVIPQRQHLL